MQEVATFSGCTRWPSRTPSAPISGPNWSATTNVVPGPQNRQLRPARIGGLAREIVETGEIMIFVGKDFVVTVRHGEHGGCPTCASEWMPPRAAAAGPLRGDARDRRPRGGPLPRRDPADGMRHRWHRGSGVRARRRIKIEPIYLLKREVVEMRRSVIRCRRHSTNADREQGPDLQGSAALPARRRRPPVRGRGRRSPATTTCSTRWCRPRWPGSGCSRTATCARYRPGPVSRGAHHGRRHLRHELPFHARAELEVGLPGDGRRHGARLPDPVFQFPAEDGFNWL